MVGRKEHVLACVVPIDCEAIKYLGPDETYAHRATVGAAAIDVEVSGFGMVTGDVAWGGNWSFLIKHHPYTFIDAAKRPSVLLNIEGRTS
jgi:hypothetical protein